MTEQSPGRASFRVFISSTYLDNAERRRVVEDAVLRADMQPVGMERFTASQRPTVEKCEDWARECDIYVGIVAHRYGWIPDGHEVSITELEYDAAKKAGRPRLMFEIDSTIPTLAQDYDENDRRWTKGQKLDKLEAFKARYAADRLLFARFTETTLSGMIVQALNDWRREYEEGEGVPAGAARVELQDGQEIVRYCRAAKS